MLYPRRVANASGQKILNSRVWLEAGEVKPLGCTVGGYQEKRSCGRRGPVRLNVRQFQNEGINNYICDSANFSPRRCSAVSEQTNVWCPRSGCERARKKEYLPETMPQAKQGRSREFLQARAGTGAKVKERRACT